MIVDGTDLKKCEHVWTLMEANCFLFRGDKQHSLWPTKIIFVAVFFNHELLRPAFLCHVLIKKKHSRAAETGLSDSDSSSPT